jgi:hypothetical protein
MTPDRAEELAVRIRADYAISMGAKAAIKQAIILACAEHREMDAMICDTTAEFHGFYGTAAKDAAVKIRGQT